MAHFWRGRQFLTRASPTWKPLFACFPAVDTRFKRTSGVPAKFALICFDICYSAFSTEQESPMSARHHRFWFWSTLSISHSCQIAKRALKCWKALWKKNRIFVSEKRCVSLMLLKTVVVQFEFVCSNVSVRNKGVSIRYPAALSTQLEKGWRSVGGSAGRTFCSCSAMFRQGRAFSAEQICLYVCELPCPILSVTPHLLQGRIDIWAEAISHHTHTHTRTHTHTHTHTHMLGRTDIWAQASLLLLVVLLLLLLWPEENGLFCSASHRGVWLAMRDCFTSQCGILPIWSLCPTVGKGLFDDWKTGWEWCELTMGAALNKDIFDQEFGCFGWL